MSEFLRSTHSETLLINLDNCRDRCMRCGEPLRSYPFHTHPEVNVRDVNVKHYECWCHICGCRPDALHAVRELATGELISDRQSKF